MASFGQTDPLEQRPGRSAISELGAEFAARTSGAAFEAYSPVGSSFATLARVALMHPR